MRLTFDTLHHAYLIEGDESARDALLSCIEHDLQVNHLGNPDVVITTYDRLTVEEGRELALLATRKPFADRKFFVVTCQSITRETQNAFLKLLEDPPKATHFFLIVPKADILIGTLRSRLFPFQIKTEESSFPDNLPQAFIKGTPGARIELVAEIVAQKDSKAAIFLLNAIEEKLIEGVEKDHDTQVLLKEIQQARTYLYDRAPSLKGIMEHIASLPR